MSNKLTYPLVILIFASIISVFYQIASYTSQLNIGSSFTFNILGYDLSFSLGTEGIILLIVVCGGIGAIVGVNILGSGLSTMAQAIVYKSVFYFGLWAIFSVLSVDLIFSIPIVGSVIWLVLTLFYCLGVQEQVGTHPT
jgi:hypothetical protein